LHLAEQPVLELAGRSADRIAHRADLQLRRQPVCRMARQGLELCPDPPSRRRLARAGRAPPVAEAGAMRPKVEVRSLNAWIKDNHALRNVSLTVPAKTVHANIGPSDCGKNTFVSCLNHLHELDNIT